MKNIYILIGAILLTSCLQKNIEYDCTNLKQNYNREGFYAEEATGELFYFNKGFESAYFSEEPSILLNSIKKVVKAEVHGTPTIGVWLNKEGSEQLVKLTKNSIKKHIGIFIQDKLVMAPIVNSEIKGGELEISSGTKGKSGRDELYDYLSLLIYCNNKKLKK